MLFVVTLWCRFFFCSFSCWCCCICCTTFKSFLHIFFPRKNSSFGSTIETFQRKHITIFHSRWFIFLHSKPTRYFFFYGMLIIVFLCSTFHSISHFAWIHLHTDNKHTTHKILTHIIHRTISINSKNDIRQVHVQNKMCKKNELKIYASNAWQKKHTLSTVCIYCTVHSTCGFFCLSDS